ncbi:MAG: hypothetical protein WA432_04885 [Candidatus Babeliaceae bacterium]
MMKKFLLVLFFLPLSIQTIGYNPILVQKEWEREMLARAWINFSKQVGIAGAVTFGGLALYDLIKHIDTVPKIILGSVILYGACQLNKDLNFIAGIVPKQLNGWAVIWGIILGSLAYHSAISL